MIRNWQDLTALYFVIATFWFVIDFAYKMANMKKWLGVEPTSTIAILGALMSGLWIFFFWPITAMLLVMDGLRRLVWRTT
jgi:hypothetical protein